MTNTNASLYRYQNAKTPELETELMLKKVEGLSKCPFCLGSPKLRQTSAPWFIGGTQISNGTFELSCSGCSRKSTGVGFHRAYEHWEATNDNYLTTQQRFKRTALQRSAAQSVALIDNHLAGEVVHV